MRYARCCLLSVYVSFRLSPLRRSRRRWNFPLLLIARFVNVGYPGWLFRRTAHLACVTLPLSLILSGVALRSASISVGATRGSEAPRSWSVHCPRTGFTPNSCHVRLSDYVAFNDRFTRAAWICVMPNNLMHSLVNSLRVASLYRLSQMLVSCNHSKMAAVLALPSSTLWRCLRLDFVPALWSPDALRRQLLRLYIAWVLVNAIRNQEVNLVK